MSEDAANSEREAMEYDVVIVGAGPSGLAAAIRLKQISPDLSVAVTVKFGPVELLPFALEPGDGFGSSVTAIGDVNDDGVADIADQLQMIFADALLFHGDDVVAGDCLLSGGGRGERDDGDQEGRNSTHQQA